MMALFRDDPAIVDSTINAIYRFAEVVAKSDGTVTESEKTALRQIWDGLHQNPTEE